MKKLMVFMMVSIFLISCASQRGIRQEKINQDISRKPGDKLIWKSHEKRPQWTVREPELEGQYMYFVGLSGMHALEKEARTDAMRGAVNTIVGYLGTEVREKFERIVVRFGLSSEIANPTRAARNFERQVKDNIAARVKAKEYYIEQWRNRDKDIYWKAYVLSKVPKSALEQAFINEVNKARDNLKRARMQANNAQAKKQLDDAMEAFNKAAQDGFDE